jgi:hypothetical protein
MKNFKLITTEALLTQRDKFEIYESLNNSIVKLRSDIRKAIYITAVLQFLGIVIFVWVFLYFFN